MAHARRVAVIGAGASGLPAIKCCKDGGLNVVCFERSCDIGGLWRFTEEAVENEACVMKSTIINTSKEMMAYSDFPPPAHLPNYMHNKLVLEYLRMYAQEFDLVKNIQFETEVLYVCRADDFATSGKWRIKVKHKKSGLEKEEIFDGVLVCTGHHAKKHSPHFKGLETFKGKVVHTHDFRNVQDYIDKNIVVIGIGNSGGDVAVELSKIAKQVYLSTRRGSWIINRVNEGGLPVDLAFGKRPMALLLKAFPNWTQEQMAKNLNQRFDHAMYSLKPDFPPGAQHPTINDELPNRIVAGTIKIKDDIAELKASSVNFVDGTTEQDIDAVIMATGYSFGFPFLDKQIIDVNENQVDLYKLMFPPDLEHSTLAVIGCFQPLGAVMPISEMQARLAVRVIKGEKSLPSSADMWTDIRFKQTEMAKRYVKSRRHTIQVDYIQYMDELAHLIGCNIRYEHLLLTDPSLAKHVMFGPVYPYHYRLYGPETWPGAREAILTAWERVMAPLQTRRVPQDTKTDAVGLGRSLLFKVAALIAVPASYYIYWSL